MKGSEPTKFEYVLVRIPKSLVSPLLTIAHEFLNVDWSAESV